MILSLSLIIIVGFALSAIFQKIRIPSVVSLILTGIILGPYVLNLIAPEVLAISLDLRQLALIIILLRAGLSLDLNDLKKVGTSALLMSFFPATFEIIGVIVLAPLLLGFTYLEAAILGSILGAVSPAIVVPRMLTLMKEKRGTKKKIPQLIMAGSSLDDVYTIVIFTSLVQMGKTGTFNWLNFVKLPISIILGILVGVVFGLLFVWFFKKFHIRDTIKVIIILSFALFFLSLENLIADYVPYSGLLSSLALGITIYHQYGKLAQRLVIKYEKIWIFAEMLLFVLVGAAVDISTIPLMGVAALILIFGALLFRAVGVLLATIKDRFTVKEKTFLVGAYIPKATVQASIASFPLALGLSNGQMMLTVAVLAILITAPLGAFFIDLSKDLLLEKEIDLVSLNV